MIRYFRDDQSLRRALIWLVVFAAVGAALVLLYHDADQQDSGYHFLFARWAHRHPRYLVGVWARPLFTLLYFPFAQFGYAAAKFFTVIISLAAAWQTFRLARQVKFDRAELAIPLLFLQPSFFLLCSTVLTETLFALVFVIALRLHLSGRIRIGMIVASLLILVRPEGFFIGVLWGIWVLFGVPPSDGKFGAPPSGGEFGVPPSGGRVWSTSRFRLKAATPNYGSCEWNDPLVACGLSDYGRSALDRSRLAVRLAARWQGEWHRALWRYVVLLPLIVGPLLIAPFIAGLWRLVKRRELGSVVSAFLVLFIAHSLMFWRGWFGSAGYARYFVCVSPAIALITLAGWNELAERSAGFFGPARRSFAAIAARGVVPHFCLLR